MENFHCIPFRKIWDLTVPGTCYNWTYGLLIASIINVVSDVAIFILPQAVIWKLNMSRRRKIGLSFIFTLGLLYVNTPFPHSILNRKYVADNRHDRGCVAATIRLAQTVKFVKSDDKVYNVSAMTLAATAEMTCGFIVFGLPYAVKVFSGERLLSRLLTSLGSLIGLVTRRQSASNEDQGRRWPQNSPGAKPSNEYLMLDNNGIPLEQLPTPKDSSISTSRMQIGC